MRRDQVGVTTGSTIQHAARLGLLLALVALILLPPITVVAQVATPQPQVYVVQPGDTLAAIAQQFGTTVDALVAANNIADPRLIFVGQNLVIPGGSAAPQPTAEPQTYVVQPGDTLASIAQRFGTTWQAIVATNKISDPALIVVGQSLTIPSGTSQPGANPTSASKPVVRRVHHVQLGETLPFLAFRYGTSVWAIRARNTLDPLGLLWPNQELEIPPPTAATDATPRLPDVALKPTTLVQGRTVAIEVRTSSDLELTGQFLGQGLQFVPDQDGYFALIGVDVLTKVGSYPWALSAVEKDTGDQLTMQGSASVVAGTFSSINVTVPADRQYLLDPTLSNAEAKKVNQIFAQVTGTQQWHGAFSAPLAGEMPISAGFGQKRSYNGGPATSYHAGEDIPVPAGTPVLATADGTVVLAEKLQVRGNAVIIDHGLGVFTGFWHLSEIDVHVGQVVKRGDVVGLVGNTGLSTGAHLHWEMHVHGVPVYPPQWTQQAFP